MDVHKVTISVAVRDDAGMLVMESTIETKATAILDFIRSVRGSVCVTFEEATVARRVARPAEAPRQQGDRMRSADERPAEERQQERPHGCAEAERSITHRIAVAGLSRRVRGSRQGNPWKVPFRSPSKWTAVRPRSNARNGDAKLRTAAQRPLR